MFSADLQLGSVLRGLLLIMAVALLLALLLLALLLHRLRRLQLPPDAGFFETLRAVPLGLVVVLDLLDLGLDFLSAPISWALLRRLGLQQLRQVTLFEALIPGTQFIPTMTLAWLIARYAGRALPEPQQRASHQERVIDHDPPSSLR